MLIIKQIDITSFRSILNLKIEIDNTLNLVAVCGENNVGKTNTLRAINLFFFPEMYQVNLDRPTIKHAQGGARIDPKIIIEFFDSDIDCYYSITRDFKFLNKKNDNELKGKKFKRNGDRIERGTNIDLSYADVIKFLEPIEFKYIESINVDIPKLVDELTSDAIDVEYQKSRITNNKAELKKAYESYTNGLQEILNVFSESISETFKKFRDNWGIAFSVPNTSETFRDLISDDVQLMINDKGCLNVEQKGSGLQRLAVILLNFEIAKRTKNKKYFIFCIDEPDIYLHEGMQRKLMSFFQESSEKFQILYTTHSKVFINRFDMKNTVLLSAKHHSQPSARKNRNIDVVETILIDTSVDEGFEKICEHLGLEKSNYDILDRHNILVEGGCDKKYIEQLADYFGLLKPKLISLDGVSNAEKYLDFYNSYYKDNQTEYKPKVKVLFDNDHAGREVYQRLKGKRYNYLDVSFVLLQNFSGEGSIELQHNSCNHEIEDFLYPEVVCYLVNILLEKKSLNKIIVESVVKSIRTPSFKNKGILELIEYQKNIKNPSEGQIFCLTSSDKVTNDIKNGLAGLFNIEGNRAIISILNECNKKYPYTKEFLNDLLNFS